MNLIILRGAPRKPGRLIFHDLSFCFDSQDVPVEHLAKVWTTKHHDRPNDESHHSTRHEALHRSSDVVLA